MFSFFKKKSLLQTGLFNGFTDFHAHILPSVDDGLQSIEQTMETLEYYENIGIKKLIMTPHIIEDYPDNDFENLTNKFIDLKSIYKGTIELSLGAEYMLDSKFEQHLNNEKLLTLFDNYLLVEFSYMNPPLHFKTQLQKIQAKGYFVVLAHPERYLYMQQKEYDELLQMGILFQLNIPSLLNIYNSQVKKRALNLLSNNSYSFVGTDLHNIKHFKRTIEKEKISNKVCNSLLTLRNKSNQLLLSQKNRSPYC